MKKLISIYFVSLVFCLGSVFAQLPNAFTYQCVIRDGDGNVLREQNINLQINILSGSEDGSSAFSETQAATSNVEGLVTVSIGAVEDLSIIDWANGPYYIKILANEVQQDVKEIVSLPYAMGSLYCYEADSLSYDELTNKPDFSSWDIKAEDDFNGFYNSLRYWSVVNRDLYYNSGKVLVGGDDPSGLSDNFFHVQGAVLYNGGPTDTVPGVLYFDPAGNGSFRYFNNNGEMKVIGAGTISFTDADPLAGDVYVAADAIWKNRICLGDGGSPGYDFGNNVFAIASDTIRVYFFDTSTSAQFPSNDWQMRFNDLDLGGDNYFAVFDSSHQSTPFVIFAGMNNNAIIVSIDGSMGIGQLSSEEKVEVDGNVVGTFIGSGGQLTGLDGVATDAVENIGSTTIAADTDSDGSGDIIFETRDTVRIRIKANGSVKVGSGDPDSEFDASGLSCVADGMEVSGYLDVNTTLYSVFEEFDPGANALSYDVTNKKNIVFNSSIGNISLNGLQNGLLGQEVTIVNKSAIATVQLTALSGTQMFLNPAYQNIILNQYESVTYIFNGNYWLCMNLVE